MKFRSTIFLLTAIAAFYACNKSSDLPIAQPPATNLNVINTTTDTLNVYLNGTRQNNTSSIYSGGSTGYLTVASGEQNYQFKKNRHAEVLFSKPLTLNVLKTDTTIDKNPVTIYTPLNYTLFVCGETADKAFLVTDTLTSDQKGTRVRFANSASAAQPLDVAINDTIYYRNVGFKAISQLKTIGPGPKIIKVYETGQNVVKATQTITLLPNQVFTLYVKGTPNGVGTNALAVGIFGNTF